jgi:hypothetical protein
MLSAVKLTVKIGVALVIELSDDVPVGPPEIIMLMGGPAPVPNALDDFEPIEPASLVRMSDLTNAGGAFGSGSV